MPKKRQSVRICHVDRAPGGFSLIELMIVVAITAILASVAVPAYINHINRAKQMEAVTALMTAKMEQEVYWEEGNRYVYAGTIGCLPSFCSSAACLTSCASCSQTTYMTGSNGYSVSVTLARASTFTVRAQRTIPSSGAVDTLTISADSAVPTVVDPEAIGFSWFKLLFP